MIKFDNRQIRILLVDDTPANLEIAVKILEQEHYDLYIADSGLTALELIEKITFDLILMDIMMPDMDGFETYKRIREKEKNKDLPIIFLTAKVDIESMVKGFELGAVDYIRKPFNGLELKARVRNHVELKKIREEAEQKNKKLLEAYEALEIIATTDPLTKLLNRREMLKRMEYERVNYERSQSPFSIVIADIDFFKKVNDTYGHDCGDHVLMSVAELLQTNARKQDSISRWGGEEFLLMLPDTDATGATILAEKLRRKIEESLFDCDMGQIKVTLTFGISVFMGNEALDKLISKADGALYEGKQNGRNRVVLSQSAITNKEKS